jgi:hypothetical protein
VGGDGSPALPHYAIRAILDPPQHTLSVSAVVTFPPAPAGSVEEMILGRSYRVSRMLASNGVVVAEATDRPFRGLQAIRVRRAVDGPTAVTLEYEGALTSFVTPPMNVISPELVELSVDSFWLPYSARLGALFTIEGSVDGLPPGATVVSSLSFRRTPTGIRIPRSTPTGDVALVAAPGLVSVREGRFVFYGRDVESDLAKAYRRHGAGALTMLESVLGRLPTEQASVVIVRRASRSGYARPGYVIVTERPDTVPEHGTAKFIAHELAHAWFSRAAFDTEDYWLVETPAEYLGLRYVETALGRAARDSMLEAIRRAAATAGPILGSGRQSSAAIYSKGPALLFDLEERIGRGAMDAVLSELARSKVHTTTVFFEILSRVAGETVAKDLEQRMRL